MQYAIGIEYINRKTGQCVSAIFFTTTAEHAKTLESILRAEMVQPRASGYCHTYDFGNIRHVLPIATMEDGGAGTLEARP